MRGDAGTEWGRTTWSASNKYRVHMHAFLISNEMEMEGESRPEDEGEKNHLNITYSNIYIGFVDKY